MFYLMAYFFIMLWFVLQIEKKIRKSKYLVKRAHAFRHKTRELRKGNKKEIEEYITTSDTHQYYLKKGLKNPDLLKMKKKHKISNVDHLRFEMRIFYYSFFSSILFGFTFTLSGLYKDEFISSLYPHIEPYFKILYNNFDKYTFNPLAYKVCFSWILIFTVLNFLIFLVYSFVKQRKMTKEFIKLSILKKEGYIYLIASLGAIWGMYSIFNDESLGSYGARFLFNFPLSFGLYSAGIFTTFLSVYIIFLMLTHNIYRYLLRFKGN